MTIQATGLIQGFRAYKHRAIIEGIVIGIILTSLSYLVGALAGWITGDINLLEAFAVFTSYGSTYLCVVQKRFNYIFGAISTASYAILFFQLGLYASAALNAYLPFALIYGWFRWRSDDNTRPVEHVRPRWIPVYLIITVATYASVIFIISLLGATLPVWDAVILVGSILAQFLLDNKKIETWMVWAVVNVAAIYVYFNAGLALAGFQYIFFLANTVYGYISWRQSMKKKKAETPGVKGLMDAQAVANPNAIGIVLDGPNKGKLVYKDEEDNLR